MNPVQRSQLAPPAGLPPTYEETLVEDAVSGNCIDQYPLAQKMLILKFQTCKAVVDGNFHQALKTLSDRIALGEKISMYSDNLEGRTLQRDWQHAKVLAANRIELLRRELSEQVPRP